MKSEDRRISSCFYLAGNLLEEKDKYLTKNYRIKLENLL